MNIGEMFELRRQIHELRTDAIIMEAAMRAYEKIIEEQHNQDVHIVVVIDMNSHDIIEYCGYYDHGSVKELLDNIDEALEFIDDQIDKTAEYIRCELVWERADQDDCSTTYLELVYLGTYTFCTEDREEI